MPGWKDTQADLAITDRHSRPGRFRHPVRSGESTQATQADTDITGCSRLRRQRVPVHQLEAPQDKVQAVIAAAHLLVLEATAQVVLAVAAMDAAEARWAAAVPWVVVEAAVTQEEDQPVAAARTNLLTYFRFKEQCVRFLAGSPQQEVVLLFRARYSSPKRH